MALASTRVEVTELVDLATFIAGMLTAPYISEVFTASWAFAWLGECQP